AYLPLAPFSAWSMSSYMSRARFGFTAAPGTTDVQRTVSVSAAPVGLDVHRGKYVSLGGCQTAGQQGIERGHWDQYQCAQGSFWLWNLWTNR
ncbi:hypothetical protein ACFVGN_44770, partial [Streptomyces sp. NPDC057757]|uniref:hypothetical protein n=1 Tax=Streptomyces sp. NPDC057757 TaxID=3346241 RepID=UPI00367712D3